MFLSIVLFASAFALAGAAGFFSIAGLATTYGGSYWAVVALGSTIEWGKLVAVSFLYRFWPIISWQFRSVLIALIIGVMLVTSMGVFGFLTKANQVDSISLKQNQATLTLLEQEEQQLRERKQQIDKQIAELPASTVTGRARLMSQFKTETTTINTRLPEITKEKTVLSQQQIHQQAEVGPMIFIANAFGYSPDVATTWFTLLLVLVFDPMAICLTFAANIALAHQRRDPPRDSAPPTYAEDAPSKEDPACAVADISPVETAEIIVEPSPVVSAEVTTVESLPTTITATIIAVNDTRPTQFSLLDHVDVELVEETSMEQAIDEEIVEMATVDIETEEEQHNEESEARRIMKDDFTHFINRKIRAEQDPEELRTKINQLREYVAELDATPDEEITEDEYILRGRIKTYLDRFATTHPLF